MNRDDQREEEILAGKAYPNVTFLLSRLDTAKKLIESDCENDESVRALIAPILGDSKVDGNSYEVPTIPMIVEDLIKHYGDREKVLVEALEQLDPVDYECDGFYICFLCNENGKYHDAVIHGADCVYRKALAQINEADSKGKAWEGE